MLYLIRGGKEEEGAPDPAFDSLEKQKEEIRAILRVARIEHDVEVEARAKKFHLGVLSKALITAIILGGCILVDHSIANQGGTLHKNIFLDSVAIPNSSHDSALYYIAD